MANSAFSPPPLDFFEHPRSKTPPSKEQAALKLVQDLAGPAFGEQKRKGVTVRQPKQV